MEIPHSNSLDVAIYQGYGSGKTWCGSFWDYY